MLQTNCATLYVTVNVLQAQVDAEYDKLATAELRL